ncbi:hypothetical protein [Mycolicibacterium hippocampi]|uniref:hypothetical protein n=1 Tax=Mycobacteriaceae TaxID=1762 RepID=UPI0015B3FEF1|nr:hypothetical protein [Mycolicibacterium hippocampi]
MVVVVTVVTTLLFTRDGSSTDPPTASPSAPSTSSDASEIASADDDKGVGIIVDEPTCAAWTPIGDTFAEQAAKGWNDRDPSIPASDWTEAQRVQHLAIADAMRSAADQTAALVKLTPHRVVRELYEQSIAYWRDYANKVPTYTPADDHLARVATGTSNALVWICSAITYGSASARAPLVVESPAPLDFAPLGDPSDPERFVTEPLSVCSQWSQAVEEFDRDTSEWLATDPNLSVSQWPPEQQAIYVEMTTVMQTNAGKMQDLGLRSGNAIFYDFATLAAQYRRGFVQSFPSYVPSDAYLANAAAELIAANDQACKAAGSQ